MLLPLLNAKCLMLLRWCAAGANQGDIESNVRTRIPPPEMRRPDSKARAARRPSCGVQTTRMSCSMSLLPSPLPATRAAAACRELENVGAQGYPSVALASWRYLLWYSAFSGFSGPRLALPKPK